jgi:hypothetical protein
MYGPSLHTDYQLIPVSGSFNVFKVIDVGHSFAISAVLVQNLDQINVTSSVHH